MNIDESLKCLNLSKKKFESGDFDGSLKFAEKAVRMQETKESLEWLSVVQKRAQEQGPKDSSEETTETEKPEVRHRNINNNNSNNTNTTQKPQPSPETENHKMTSEANYSQDMLKEVKLFMKRNKEDYYAVLDIKKDVTDVEVKKAYKRMALKFHPDKNRAPGADEAFKIIARAFSVLSDADKRAAYDRYGSGVTDNNNGFGGGGFNPSNFAFRGGNNMNADISPEEIFNMFFGGAFPSHAHAHAHPFSSGPQFTFHHSFGGSGGGPEQFFFQNFARPQQRTRPTANSRHQQQYSAPEDPFKKLLQYIPLIIIVLLSILSSWVFPDNSTASNSELNQYSHLISLSPTSKHRFSRLTTNRKMDYYASNTFQRYFEKLKSGVDETAKGNANANANARLARELKSYEEIVERSILKNLQSACKSEERALGKQLSAAKKDTKKQEEIKKKFKLNSCEKLKSYGLK